MQCNLPLPLRCLVLLDLRKNKGTHYRVSTILSQRYIYTLRALARISVYNHISIPLNPNSSERALEFCRRAASLVKLSAVSSGNRLFPCLLSIAFTATSGFARLLLQVDDASVQESRNGLQNSSRHFTGLLDGKGGSSDPKDGIISSHYTLHDCTKM